MTSRSRGGSTCSAAERSSFSSSSVASSMGEMTTCSMTSSSLPSPSAPSGCSSETGWRCSASCSCSTASVVMPSRRARSGSVGAPPPPRRRVHGLGSHAQSTGEFGQRRLPPQLYEQGVERLAVLAGALDDVHGQADCARLVGKGARDRLTDPPGDVGAELEAAPVVELLDAADEAGVPFLDEVEQRQGAGLGGLGGGG